MRVTVSENDRVSEFNPVFQNDATTHFKVKSPDKKLLNVIHHSIVFAPLPGTEEEEEKYMCQSLIYRNIGRIVDKKNKIRYII